MKENASKNKILRFLWGFFPWFIVIVLLALGVTLFFNIIERKNIIEEEKRAAIKEEASAVRVITLTVNPENLSDKINLPAEIEAFEDLEVKAEASGQVINVLVKEGQDIEEGQLLIQLDNRDYVSRINQIEANYSLAKQDYERISALVEKKIAAKSDLDNVNARIKGLKAQLNEAKRALDRTNITAPISGRVNRIMAKKGDWVGMAKPIAQILQYGKVKVTVGLPESDVASVFNLTEAEVIIDALNGLRVTGVKYFLSRQPRSMARLYNMELLVDNPDGRILPGMFARVEIVKDVFMDALKVPLYAVISEGSNHFVYIENGSKAHKKQVTLGILDEWQVHIPEGLNPGDRVIFVGHRMLDDGQKVEVTRNVSDPKEILGL